MKKIKQRLKSSQAAVAVTGAVVVPDKKKIAGVVLAGGRSSRMGKDKALLDYNGRPLLDHMITLLEKTGVRDVYVSGNYKGYRCIPDSAPYEGPARAIADVLAVLENYEGVLFVPVDMPLLSVDVLRLLIRQERGGYFKGSPLPAFINKSCSEECFRSVKDLLVATKTYPVILPPDLKSCMANINTPEEWVGALRA